MGEPDSWDGDRGHGREDCEDRDVEAAIQYLERIREAMALEAGKGLRVRAEVHLYRQQILLERVLDGGGRGVRDARSGAWIEIRASIPDGGISGARLAAATVDALIQRETPDEVGRVLGRRCRESKGAPIRAAGVFPVVFAAGGCETLLHEIGHLFEGPVAVSRTGSWDPGARIASPRVTIVDDPAGGMAGRGGYRFDDEGDAPRRTVLIDAGRIADRILGGPRIGGNRTPPSTGHARRASYRDLPRPRMACTLLEPGPDDPRAIISETRKGIFVRRLGTGSMDPASGRVTLSVTEGFHIEKGCITHPLAPSLLLGDFLSMLGSIDAVGSDFTFDHGATNCVKGDQQLPVMVGLPTIRIGMITVISP